MNDSECNVQGTIDGEKLVKVLDACGCGVAVKPAVETITVVVTENYYRIDLEISRRTLLIQRTDVYYRDQKAAGLDPGTTKLTVITKPTGFRQTEMTRLLDLLTKAIVQVFRNADGVASGARVGGDRNRSGFGTSGEAPLTSPSAQSSQVQAPSMPETAPQELAVPPSGKVSPTSSAGPNLTPKSLLIGLVVLVVGITLWFNRTREPARVAPDKASLPQPGVAAPTSQQDAKAGRAARVTSTDALILPTNAANPTSITKPIPPSPEGSTASSAVTDRSRTSPPEQTIEKIVGCSRSPSQDGVTIVLQNATGVHRLLLYQHQFRTARLKIDGLSPDSVWGCKVLGMEASVTTDPTGGGTRVEFRH